MNNLHLFKTILEQDNRITSHPIFFVQDKRRIYGADPQFHDEYIWVYDGEDMATDSEARALDRMSQSTVFRVPEGWEKVYYAEYWATLQPFFTEVGAQSYIDRNRHHFSDPRIYVASGDRNDEWQAIREFLLSEVERERKGGSHER